MSTTVHLRTGGGFKTLGEGSTPSVDLQRSSVGRAFAFLKG